ncbi:hypothetical protein H2248_009485 [Termitomyces sp. 'cryptogamus']|nr:hypothetical protein H2248_009485 [Termitomyces sp. 'cryptogamus']
MTSTAWKNQKHVSVRTLQSGHPVNARTCKYLKSLFGDKYEEARLKLKTPNGPPPKSTAKSKGRKMPQRERNLMKTTLEIKTTKRQQFSPLQKPLKIKRTKRSTTKNMTMTTLQQLTKLFPTYYSLINWT